MEKIKNFSFRINLQIFDKIIIISRYGNSNENSTFTVITRAMKIRKSSQQIFPSIIHRRTRKQFNLYSRSASARDQKTIHEPMRNNKRSNAIEYARARYVGRYLTVGNADDSRFHHFLGIYSIRFKPNLAYRTPFRDTCALILLDSLVSKEKKKKLRG